MTDGLTQPEPEVLFAENGASWWWLAVGPVSAVVMMGIQLSSGYGWSPALPAIFLTAATFFIGIQVKAAKMHTSVELTPEHLRQGTEIVPVSDIVWIYPEADGAESPSWESARALGELIGVPRKRTGIGLKLTNGRKAQAWARRHRRLRAALESVVDP